MQEAIHHKIKIQKTAHYYTLGQLSANTRYLWLVCHGYGQLASRFIQKFRQLDPKRHFVIAPEGFSRFYWGGVTGEVVASWMTKNDKQEEIEDHTNFLNSIYRKYAGIAPQECEWIMLGFSQGNATIIRYLERFQPSFKNLLIWAGRLPRESCGEEFTRYLNQGSLHYFYGNEDIYVTTERIGEEREFMKHTGLQFNIHQFEGEHRVDKKALADWVNKFLS